jgi:hypothetical protein
MSNPNCPFCGAKDIYKCGSWGIDAQETRNPLCREREAHNQTKRERDEARDKSERYRLEANAFMMQRDTLVQKLDAWQEIAEHLHHFVQYPAYGVDQAIQRMDVLEAYKHLKHGH